MTRCRFLLVLLLLMPGCSRKPTFSQADLDRARQALVTSLDAWKKGEPPPKLRSLPEPIEFAEEWPKTGLRLLEYQILDDRHTDSETMRFRVKLIVQTRQGKKEEREATYAVALKQPIAVGRDPFF